MNGQGTQTALVQRVRTFAGDVRRAKAQGGDAPPLPAKSPSAPVAVAQAPRPLVKQPISEKKDVGQPPKGPLAQKPSAPEAPPQPAETSRLTDNKKPLDIRKEAGNAQEEATIIKDTRRKQWTLTGALGHSLTEWVDEQKNKISEIADGKGPEPNVPPLHTRVGVMRAARQKSALAPQDDRRVVVEKLRTFARDAKRATGKSFTGARAATREKTAPSWSYIGDDQAPSDAGVEMPGTEKKAPPVIKQARETIRPPVTPLIRTNVKPSRPVKSLAKDVAPQAQQALPENAFVQLQKDKAVKPAQTASVPYGVADIAPLAPHTRNVQPPVAQAPRVATPPPDQEAADARQAAIEQLLAVRARQAEQKKAAPTPTPESTLSSQDEGAASQADLPEQIASVPYGVADIAPLAPHTRNVQPPVAKPEPPSRDIAFEPPIFATAKTTSFRTYRDDAIQDVVENKRSIPNIAALEVARRAERTRASARPAPPAVSARPFVIAGGIMIFIIAIAGFGFFWYAQKHEGEDAAAVSIPTFIAIDAQKSALFSTNRATLLETLNREARAAGSGVTQIYPTYAESPGRETSAAAVAASDFMYVLDPRAPGSFIRALSEEMMFGAWDGADPFFIFKTKQFDAAFAGMLDWEQYMSADLAPLFGSVVERTYDPAARTVDQTRNAYFVDERLRNVDVRILYDDTGKERLLYAFPNKNTIVITSSRAALIALVERLK